MTLPDKCRERVNTLKCVVVIPTYNNAGTIARVLSDVAGYSDNILVVNDGSTDDTANILSSFSNIRIITYQKNRGKGYALKQALKTAAQTGYDYAITIDADGQHFADDIPAFIDRIEQVPHSLLIGARNLTADNMPSKNTFANKFSNFWYKVETGQALADTQSGYRLYPLRKLRDMRFVTRHYDFEVEIIVRAAWKGIHVENVPVKVYYPPVEERVSHFKPLTDFTRISLLNSVLVICALLFYYPWRFMRAMTKENIRNFFDKQVLHSPDSNFRMACAMGWGIFCGIIPLWGYQMIFAAVTAHFMRLNKVVALVFSNISIPPMIPFILYGSVVFGAAILGIDNPFTLDSISIENIGMSLTQYIIGSLALAVVSGLAVFCVSWLIMILCNRKKYE